MIDFDKLTSLLAEMKLQSDKLASALRLKKHDKEMLIFYALGFLADNYIQMAEDFLKKGREYEATYFTAKAEEIRQVCLDVFEDLPERDYYKGLYFKAPKVRTSLDHAQLQQLGQFCAANIMPDEEVMKDPELLVSEVRRLLKKHGDLLHAGGIEARMIEVLKKRFKQLVEKPPKLSGVYEMLLVLENVEKIQEMLKEKEAEKRSEKPHKRHLRYGKSS